MPTRHAGTEGEKRALNAYIKLMRAAESVTQRVHRHLSANQLTVSQFGALEALHHLGPMCQKDLGGKLLKSGANVTVVVDNLEKRGLVRRERDAADRRYVTVHLTDPGRVLIEEVFPRHVAEVVAELSHLSAPEQEVLGDLCRKLGLREASKTGGPPGRSPRGRERASAH